MAQLVKNLPVSAGDASDMSSVSVSGRCPGEGNGNLLQCSCLENPMDRGAWRATVHRVTKSQTRLKQLNMDARTINKHGHPNFLLRCMPLLFNSHPFRFY